MKKKDKKTSRQRRREARLEQLLETALNIVVQEGFAALSIHRLAREAEFTPGALYRYFDSKGHLIAKLTELILEELSQKLEAAVGSLSPGTPLRKVVVLVAATQSYAENAPHRFGLLALLLADPHHLIRSQEVASPVLQAALQALQPLLLSLEEAVESAELSPGDAMERVLVLGSMVHGLLLLYKQQKRTPELLHVPRLLEQGLNSLLLGWGADPSKLDPALKLLSL